MGLTVNAGNGGNTEFENCPAGSFAARCYQIIDLGHQTIEWQGTAKVVPKVRITWELAEQMSDGRPFSISKEYTASIGEKANLRKDLEAWRGRAFTAEELRNFSLENVLGAQCLLGVVHKPSKDGAKTYANVGSIMALPKGMACPELVNPAVKFDIGNFDQKVFESLSNYVQKKILMSKELEETGLPIVAPGREPEPEIEDESVPF
jgi:hypothetical protein